MTKVELVSKIAEGAGLSKKDADKVVGVVFDAITDALKAGDKVQLVGFGTFSVKDRPARTAINPATKAKIEVAATRVPAFKAGKGLKDVIAGK